MDYRGIEQLEDKYHMDKTGQGHVQDGDIKEAWHGNITLTDIIY